MRSAPSLAEQHLEDIKALDAKMKTVRARIDELVTSTGSHLADLYGIGPVIAGRILAEVETIDRFPSQDHFASYNGTAPIDASSGEQVRHRLSRAGNRRLKDALHMMAVTQIRPTAPAAATTNANASEARPRRRRRAASNAGSLMSSIASTLRTHTAQSPSADHLRPRRQRHLHPTHRPRPRLRPRHCHRCKPENANGTTILDWKDGRLVDIEILDAGQALHQDLLD